MFGSFHWVEAQELALYRAIVDGDDAALGQCKTIS